MRFMEQFLHGEELNVPHSDVAHLWLKYIVRILSDGITRNTPFSDTTLVASKVQTFKDVPQIY